MFNDHTDYNTAYLTGEEVGQPEATKHLVL